MVGKWLAWFDGLLERDIGFQESGVNIKQVERKIEWMYNSSSWEQNLMDAYIIYIWIEDEENKFNIKKNFHYTPKKL